MADKVYKCKHFNVDLNEEVIISFYPNTNANNANAEVVNCAPETFVLEELHLYSWNNDIILGLSNPQKCLINIKFDKLQEQLELADQTHLFNSIVSPFKKVTVYQGDENEYQTHLSNYIKIESETLGTLRFMQDIYSNIDMGNVLTSVNLSCTDLISNVLKMMSCEKTISYVMDNIEKLGHKGVDYDYSKFAFDWINAKSEGEFRIFSNGGEFLNGQTTGNEFTKRTTPLGFMISGMMQKNGADKTQNTKIINNYQYIQFTGSEGDFPKRMKPFCFQHFPKREGDEYENNKWRANNGLARLQFMNIQSFYNFIVKQAQQLVSAYDDVQINNFQVLFPYFYKQNYTANPYRGDILDSSNCWFLYRIRGCGTSKRNGMGHIAWDDDEYYLTNQDVSKQLQYSSVFDLLTDVLVSSLGAYTQTENGFELYKEPTQVQELNLTSAVIEKNISFNYKIINIQTGRADLQKGTDTTTIMSAPGTAENINIPSFYNAYPIAPERAFNHAFMPNVRNFGASGEGTPYANSAEVVYATDSLTPGHYVDWWNSYLNFNGTNYKNYGNAGFYYPNNHITDWKNTSENFYHGNWYYLQGRGREEMGWRNAINAPGDGVILNLGNSRPVDMIHLNAVNFSTIKVWYREQYGNIEAKHNNSDPNYNDKSQLKAVYPNEYTFIAAHHTNAESGLGRFYYMSDFDWRWNHKTGNNKDDSSDRYLGSDDACMLNNVVTAINTLNKQKEKYLDYCKVANEMFDKFWYKLLYNRFQKEYISRIIEITVRPTEFNKVFNGIPIHQIRNYIYDIKLTNDPVKDILNIPKYRVISIEYKDSDYTIKLSSIN